MSSPAARRGGTRRLAAAVAVAAAAMAACGDSAAPGIAIERRPGEIRISTGAVAAVARLAPYRLEVLAGGRTILAEADGVFWERDGERHRPGRVVGERASGDGVVLEVESSEQRRATVALRFLTERTLEVTVTPPEPETVDALGERLASPADERIYGLTERLRDSPPLAPPVIEVPADDVRPPEAGSLDRRGEVVEMFVRPTIAIYGPFFHSSRGYGLEVDGTAVGTFDLAATDPGVIAFRFEAGRSSESRRLRFRLFYGPGHGAILAEHARVHGPPFVPPRWAFRHWRWRGELRRGPPASLDGVPMNAGLVEDVAMYEQLGIPPGVYLFDRPVLPGEFGFARFEWDEERLPHPEAMLAALRRRGYRVLVWSALWACGSEPGDNGAEAFRLGLLAPGPAIPPRCTDAQAHHFVLDPTHPDLARFWQERLGAFVARYDIDGIKLDRGEERIPSGPADVWADGRDGREIHNAYPTLQARLHYEVMARARGSDDFLVVARAGYSETARWAAVWGGDIPGSEVFGTGRGTDLGLRSAIIAQQRVAFLGYPVWGSDTGGYYQFKDREVFARWIEFSAFSGIMEIGGTGGPHAPWAMPTEPRFDEEMIAIYRRYTRLRERLLDRLAAAASEARRSGLPIVRPLVFDYPDDPEVADLWDEYLFAADLLVAPVWRTGQRSREVYLPAGAWESFWNPGQTYRGPVRLRLEAPLDQILVFRRLSPPRPAGRRPRPPGARSTAVETDPLMPRPGHG